MKFFSSKVIEVQKTQFIQSLETKSNKLKNGRFLLTSYVCISLYNQIVYEVKIRKHKGRLRRLRNFRTWENYMQRLFKVPLDHERFLTEYIDIQRSKVLL